MTPLPALRKHDLNVGHPADASHLGFAAKGNMAISKLDHELQVVYGEVYAPGFPDSQGDFMTRETIREMAFEFMRKGYGANSTSSTRRKRAAPMSSRASSPAMTTASSFLAAG